jgi:hypothetical protein
MATDYVIKTMPKLSDDSRQLTDALDDLSTTIKEYKRAGETESILSVAGANDYGILLTLLLNLADDLRAKIPAPRRARRTQRAVRR